MPARALPPQRHVVGADDRFPRIRGREERIFVLRAAGKVERILLVIDMQNEVVGVLLHGARRRDRRGAGIGRVRIGMIQLRHVRAFRILERAGAVLQQIDVVAFVEGKELVRKGAVVQRHVVGIDLRRARVCEREERILIFRGRG